MTISHRLYMVDVFAEQPYSGNPLAVVVGAPSLPDDTMQRIAAEMNFSETTFVAPAAETDGGYRVRIFTPSREIAFAGHPLLGTAWVLRNHVMAGSPARVQLNLDVGPVPVTFEKSSDDTEIAWFLAPPITPGITVARERVAVSLGLAPDNIDARSPCRVMTAGISALMVPLAGLDALRRSRLDLAAHAPLAAEGFPSLVYLYCRETHHPGNDLCARFFFEAHGVREDPATGNGAAFLGAYLLAHGGYPESGLSVRIEQGYEIRRPSLVMLRARLRNGQREISVGGQVIPTVEGELIG